MNREMMEKATFGAGCFWGVEAAFKKMPGVLETRVGYAGGYTEDPDYRRVCSGKTGHAEACEITFDPEQVSYDDLLTLFWNIHDPTQKDRQGNDVGTQYRSVIFYHNEEQKKKADSSMIRVQKSHRDKIVTKIEPAKEFWEAEGYHQDYLLMNPGGYCHVNMAKVEKIIEQLKK